VPVAAPGQNRRSPSAGRSNDRPGAPTAIAVVSSRSSEPNSVRHRQARLIHLRVKTIQADQNPSWWAATLHGVVFHNLISNSNNPLIFHVLASRILIVT